MSDFTQHWHWPQWAVVALLFIGWTYRTSQHGKPMLQISGDEKGQPVRYNGFAALSRVVIWSAILICGGFFA